ncbi:MAG: RNA 2'-phosphotransferase [Flavipsychrobacter sp.]
MISEKEKVKLSKFLSLVLRHQPEKIGIELDQNGWVEVEELINKLNEADVLMNIDTLKHVVASSEKKRFAFDSTLKKIRANQGHSVNIDLDYKPSVPPNVLYHGTAEKSLEQIFESGLHKMSRHHVHLSSDTLTALKVGQRHGKPSILVINSLEMHNDGIPFLISDNGVWLTDYVAPKYIKKIDDI